MHAAELLPNGAESKLYISLLNMRGKNAIRLNKRGDWKNIKKVETILFSDGNGNTQEGQMTPLKYVESEKTDNEEQTPIVVEEYRIPGVEEVLTIDRTCSPLFFNFF